MLLEGQFAFRKTHAPRYQMLRINEQVAGGINEKMVTALSQMLREPSIGSAMKD